MADEYKGDYFHIVSRQSQSAEIVVPLPSFCKPLAASVRPYGGGETGLLASYYDPEQHAWVVRHLPLHESWPHRPPPMLVVRVATLVDRTNLYEVRVTLSSVLDGLGNDELYALQRRSQLYALLAEEHLTDKSGATLQAASAQGQLPHLSEAVTLAAPLEVMEGFVLTGGGYVSDFPVLRDGPALPRSMEAVYDDVLTGDDFCGPPLPATAQLSSRKAKDEDSESSPEYTAWSVTAAANAGLACFSLGLRRRSPLEWAQQNGLAEGSGLIAHGAQPPSQVGAANNIAETEMRTWTSMMMGDSALVQDPTGLVASRSSSIDGPSSGAQLSRPLLETLTLRGEVKVKLSRKEGEAWSVSLPPPHGCFTFAMGSNRELLTVARKTFYCE